MAIAAVTGPLGCGKGIFAVRKAVDALERDKIVITNFDMEPDWIDRVADHHPLRWVMPGRRKALKARWKRNYYRVGSLDELVKIRLAGDQENRGVVILDELHDFINAREWRDSDRSAVVKWASKARKLGQEVYAITQDLEDIDAQVRRKMTYHIKLRNVHQMKVVGVPVVPFNLFLAIWHFHAAKAIVKREIYRLNWTKDLYDTMDLGMFADELDPADAIWLPRPPLPPPPVDLDNTSARGGSAASAPCGGTPRAVREDRSMEVRRRRLVELGERIDRDEDGVVEEDGQQTADEARASNSLSGPKTGT